MHEDEKMILVLAMATRHNPSVVICLIYYLKIFGL